MSAWVYMLKCSDGSFYTGCTRRDPEERLREHQLGIFQGYTFSRRPVQLLWFQEFLDYMDAFQRERQIKGWSRAKKMALISGDEETLKRLSKSNKCRCCGP